MTRRPFHFAVSACLAALLACAACSGGHAADAQDADASDSGSADSAQLPDDTGESADSSATDAIAPVEDSGPGDVVPTDGPPDATVPVTPDGCVAACTLADGTPKVCGSNGCGGICGFCKSGNVCKPDGTECVELCKPVCEGKKCGDNGCGGNCGVCADKFHCGIDFLCHEDACVGDCKGKQCGDDGCGLSCGDCAEGDYCDAALQCKPGPCKGIPATGSCADDLLSTCKGSGASAQKDVFDCSSTTGMTCGWDPVKSAYGCVKYSCDLKKSCTAANGQKLVCGTGKCGDTCGTCPSGWTCKATSCEAKVGAACGTVTAAGQCQGTTWVFCNTGKISAIDCGEDGLTCGWIDATQKNGCK